MALFQLKWLRRLVRRHTNPIPQNSAELWRERLSIGYAILAWQAFGLVCYMIYTGRSDWAQYYGLKSEEETKMRPAHYYATKFNVEKAKIVRLSGLSVVGETTYEKNKGEEPSE